MKFTSRIFFATLLGAAAQSALAIGGVDAPPAPASPHVVSFVAPKEATLPNGLRVIVAERRDLPLLAAQILIRSGAEVDAEKHGGTASMTGSLLTKGTETMSAPQIANAMESLGGSISSGSGWDSSSASIEVMSANAEPALRILADVILHPTFKQEEIDRLRSQRLDGLRVALQQPGSLAASVASRVVFGAGEYGQAASGTLETVSAIQRDDIVRVYAACYRPENAVLILSGNVTAEQGKRFAERFFGGWKGNEQVPNESKAAASVSEWKPSNVVIDMPQAGQAAVMIAKPMIKRDSPDYYAGLVANAALGNGFISRLNREIRIKRGLSYGARSSLDARRDVGPFAATAQTKNESAAEVASLLQSEVKRLGTEPVQGEELKSRQAVLIGGYARSMETNEGVAGQIAALAVHNLPLDTLDKFIPGVNALTTEKVTAFVTTYFDTPPSLIIVGKAPAFIEALRKSFPDVRVIAQADLDLNTEKLVKTKP